MTDTVQKKTQTPGIIPVYTDIPLGSGAKAIPQLDASGTLPDALLSNTIPTTVQDLERRYRLFLAHYIRTFSLIPEGLEDEAVVALSQ